MAQWFILYKGTKEVQGSIPTEVVFPLSREKKGSKEVDQRVGSGMYHYKKTHDLKKKDHIEKKTGANKDLINPGGCCRWEGELSPKERAEERPTAAAAAVERG